MNIVVIGVGNSIATDDGAGIRVAQRLRETISDRRLTIVESERGGLELLNFLEGSSKAYIIDAAWTKSAPPGTITLIRTRSPYAVEPLPSIHTIGLRTVLSFGQSIGMSLPDEVIVFTIEAKEIERFSEECTPEIEAATRRVSTLLASELQQMFDANASQEIGTNRDFIVNTLSVEHI
ncbi:MAG: hydrogenase maturation protease [Ignavibacteriae bacterium]|nr:hydrogenase maturation protease [Ignavibacteriota bacterium]